MSVNFNNMNSCGLVLRPCEDALSNLHSFTAAPSLLPLPPSPSLLLPALPLLYPPTVGSSLYNNTAISTFHRAS